ncbi:AraC family transcriptional regulator [bacterium]|nr:AraC family transcriptional regulator [bacterium]
MVCNRCIKVVREEMENLGVIIKRVSLGEVETERFLEYLPMVKINEVLRQNGFELIEDKKVKIVEKIKNLVIRTIYENGFLTTDTHRYSPLIEKELKLDYNYLSGLFSSLESITIEHYIILQRIERAKELLKYGELTLSEIAYKLGYSSVQHLSSQFKKITGFTATQFKSLTENMRKPLDHIS